MTAQVEGAEAIEARELDLPGIRHGFFTRRGGVSGGIYESLNGGQGSADAPEAVAENRARMARWLGLAPDHLVNVHQIHSPDVVVAEGPWTGAKPRADGLVTRTPGVGLAIATADCGPVLFADARARVIGACHSGWRGAFTGVLEATLAGMEALGAERAHVVAVLGPTIGPDAYEVGPEFVERFVSLRADDASFFRPSERAGHSLFDLPSYIGHRLSHAGVGRFADLGLCTYSDPDRFFSYRRTVHRGEPDYGRLIAAITLAA
ncbi:peptidoglycan editing factor PgeF [Alsobacter sp. R-9]